MSALGDEIKAMIASDGPMTVERYMELALGHVEHGYYMGRDPFGAAGDFIAGPSHVLPAGGTGASFAGPATRKPLWTWPNWRAAVPSASSVKS